MSVLTSRRYFLLKCFAARDVDQFALATVWESKQLAASATDLPDGFPSQTQLEAAGYFALEDINGAEVSELRARVGLQPSAAQAVIDAASAALE